MASAGRYKVLVVDDNPDWLDLLCAVLQNEYDVLRAKDGEEGLNKAAAEAPDLIFLDVLLPKATGVEVLRELYGRPDLSGAAVILMTANAFDPETEAMFRAHPNVKGYLRKPCSLRDVLFAAESVLKNAPKRTTAAAGPASAPPGGGRRPRDILVIDEDAASFQFFGLAARPEDKVRRAQDVIEAMKCLNAMTPDLILTDLILPRISGIELLRALANDPVRKDIPVILLSAVRLPPRQQETLKKDFPSIRYIFEKPCAVDALRAALESVLA